MHLLETFQRCVSLHHVSDVAGLFFPLHASPHKSFLAYYCFVPFGQDKGQKAPYWAILSFEQVFTSSSGNVLRNFHQDKSFLVKALQVVSLQLPLLSCSSHLPQTRVVPVWGRYVEQQGKTRYAGGWRLEDLPWMSHVSPRRNSVKACTLAVFIRRAAILPVERWRMHMALVCTERHHPQLGSSA